jgi:hypothetical protein
LREEWQAPFDPKVLSQQKQRRSGVAPSSDRGGADHRPAQPNVPRKSPARLHFVHRKLISVQRAIWFTAFYPFSFRFSLRIREFALPILPVSEIKREFEVGLSRHAQPQLMSSKLPTLRFRAKIMLGFAVVLAN